MNMTTDVLTVGLVVLLAVAAFLFCLRWLVQPLLRLLLSFRYRMVIVGREHIPPSGPVLVAANHVSWLDGLFLAATCPRRGQALVNATYIDWPVIRILARWIGLIPVPFSGPKAQRAMFQVCRKVLDEGWALGIFPEAQMTRNGLTGPFYRGLEAILAGREHVAVVPAYLDNLWGSLFSFSGGRFLWKKPRGVRRTVIIVYGPVLAPPITASGVRQAVIEAGAVAFGFRDKHAAPLETIDPMLPHFDHDQLGPLTGSTADYDQDGIHQTGNKPGTVGHPLPGVALRVVDESGSMVPPDTAGRLLARVPGKPEWVDVGHRASMDREGFVRLLDDTREARSY
jgi:1-acyl-sn-glycerol-3-phosphate acyltransferase